MGNYLNPDNSSEVRMKVVFGKLVCGSTYEYFPAPLFAFFLIPACKELSQAVLIPDIFFQLDQLLDTVSYTGIIHTFCNSLYLIQFIISTLTGYDPSCHNERLGSTFRHIMPASFLKFFYTFF